MVRFVEYTFMVSGQADRHRRWGRSTGKKSRGGKHKAPTLCTGGPPGPPAFSVRTRPAGGW
ncbi:unnamed protein product [Ectocarpus sp. 4 AP-2014]